MTEERRFSDIADERIARAVISILTQHGDFVTNQVLRATGSGLEALHRALAHSAVPGPTATAERMWRLRFEVADEQAILARISRGDDLGQQIIIPGDRDWPPALDPGDYRTPLALWASGDNRLLADPLPSRAAVIGTDSPSNYGAESACDIATWLAMDGRTVVSFAEAGISQMVLASALSASDRAIAVTPNPLESDPVRIGEMLAGAESGLLLSVQAPGSNPNYSAEVSSRRLLAGLSGVTTFGETPQPAKLLTVAYEAGQYGRTIAAVPGRTTDTGFSGTHELLRQGEAHLVVDGSDVADLLDQVDPAPDLMHTLRRPVAQRSRQLAL